MQYSFDGEDVCEWVWSILKKKGVTFKYVEDACYRDVK